MLVGKKAVLNKLSKTDVGKKFVIVDEYLVNGQILFVGIKDNSNNIRVVSIELVYIEDEMHICDKYVYSWQSWRCYNLLKKYETQQIYNINDFVGIEKLCWDLTHITTDISFVINNVNNHSIINAYLSPKSFSIEDTREVSTLISITITYIKSNNKYSLVLSIMDDFDVVPRDYVTHPDPWVRTMLWTSNIIAGITDDMTPIYSIGQRMKWGKFIRKQMYSAQQTIVSAISKIKDDFSDCLLQNLQYPYITVVINSWGLPIGSLGKYGHPMYIIGQETQALYDYENNPNTTIRFYGEFTIHESVFSNIVKKQQLRKPGDAEPLYKYVLLHEMIHAIFKEECTESSHGAKFQTIARLVDLPQKYSK